MGYAAHSNSTGCRGGRLNAVLFSLHTDLRSQMSGGWKAWLARTGPGARTWNADRCDSLCSIKLTVLQKTLFWMMECYWTSLFCKCLLLLQREKISRNCHKKGRLWLMTEANTLKFVCGASKCRKKENWKLDMRILRRFAPLKYHISWVMGSVKRIRMLCMRSEVTKKRKNPLAEKI